MVEQIGVRAQVGRIGEASDDIFKVMKGKQNDKVSSKGTKQVQVRMSDQDGSERHTDPNDNGSPKDIKILRKNRKIIFTKVVSKKRQLK